MKRIDKAEFLKRTADTAGEIFDMLAKLPAVNLEDLQSRQTALVIIDMVNGFTREGALKSSRIEELIPEIVRLSKKCDNYGIKKIAFADSHTEASPEFDSYPAHCIDGTSEEKIVDEIQEAGGYDLMPKNSTNGFLEEEFQRWLKENWRVNTFIITGDCTDICIQQFAVTLKAWFNMHNQNSRIIVPVNAVDTYDLGHHNGDLMHVMALYNMITNGIEVVRGVE